PVVDDNDRFSGIAGLKDIARHYFESTGFSDITDTPIDLARVLKALEGRVISNTRKSVCLSAKVLIAALHKATILTKVNPGDIVVIGYQHDIQIDLIMSGCSTLIVTDGMPIAGDVVIAAEKEGTLL